MHLEWDGEGEVFQLEFATALSGAWTPCSPILPDMSYDAACDLNAGASGYFRVRQW